jgi:formate dehydrogenase subunit gamma
LVHDVGFLTVGAAVIGHIYMAMSRPEQLKSMFTGRIDRKWAARNNPAWLEELDGEADQP